MSSEQFKYHEKCAKGHNPIDTAGAEAEPLPFSKQLGFFSPQDAARQMTLADAELFRTIRVHLVFFFAVYLFISFHFISFYFILFYFNHHPNSVAS
jgi:hypothetical protein